MRQFVTKVLPDKKGCILLTEKEKRYLIQVLRLKQGDEIEVRLPNGSLCSMHIHTDKKMGKVELVSNSPIEVEPLLCLGQEETNYWLFQILPKRQKMDLIVRQATECGVSVIVPILGQYTVFGKNTEYSSDNSGKIDRWERIIREAQQQSGSPANTKILPPCNIETAMMLWQENIQETQKKGFGFVLREKQEGQRNIFSFLQDEKDFSKACIGFVVGCEGGISPKELELLQQNDFMPIHLRTNILRAETATLYAFAVLQTVVGEYNTWKELKE